MAGRNATVVFGLLSIPVKLETAVEGKTSNLNLCVGQPNHAQHDPTPIKAPKVCESCGEITDYSALVKGVKQGSSYAIVSQEDLAEKKAEYANQYKGVFNLVPHPATDVLGATAPGKMVKFIVPANAAAEGHYQLLRQLVESHPELAFTALHTPSSATGLYVMSVRDGVLVAEERVRTQSLKATPSVGGEVNEQLFAMLDSTLEASVTPYDPDAYEDKYSAAVQALAEQAETISLKGESEQAPAGILTDADLMEKLRALKEAS